MNEHPTRDDDHDLALDAHRDWCKERKLWQAEERDDYEPEPAGWEP